MDEGTGSRYFLNADWSAEVSERIDLADPIRYSPKASRKERNLGCDDLEKKAIQWSSGPKNPGSWQSPGTDKSAQNNHPAVKPISLTRWLASLLLPPDAYASRKILIPFSGSGSEMVGALQAGWEVIHGIEMNPEYIEIAKRRLTYYYNQQYGNNNGLL